MIKRSLYFGNPAYLSLKSGQLVIKRPGSDGDMPDFDNPKTFTETVKTIPIEDIGVVVFGQSANNCHRGSIGGPT